MKTTLEQLLSQTYPKELFDILVVDGMSDDGTREFVEKFKAEKWEIGEGSPVIRLIDNPKGHRASALNIGIKEAKGNIIIRIDARTTIQKNYIEKCVKTLVETGADNVGGVLEPISRGGNITQQAFGLALSHPFGVGNAQFRLGKKSGFVDTVYLGCFKREIFDKIGLFDEESAVISEDSDVNQRIRDAGGKVYLNKDIIAYYYPRDNFKDLWKLYFRYGGARAGNLIKNKKLTAWRQFVPPTFLVSIISLTLLGLFNRYFLYLSMLLLGAYLLANILVSTYLTAQNKNPTLLPRLFTTFPIMHFSWAFGFFTRLLQRPKPGEYWKY